MLQQLEKGPKKKTEKNKTLTASPSATLKTVYCQSQLYWASRRGTLSFVGYKTSEVVKELFVTPERPFYKWNYIVNFLIISFDSTIMMGA